jgi:hypothetical protein
MAFLIGSAAFDVAAAVGLAVPAVVAGYLLVAGLATGILAAAPGAMDFVTTVRAAGGRSASKAICHAFSAWGLLLCLPCLVPAPPISGLFGGSLVLEDRVGIAEPHAHAGRGGASFDAR